MNRPLLLALLCCLTTSATAQSIRTVENAGGVQATALQGQHCRALAPGDWRIAGASPAGDAFDLTSGDGRAYAGWGIRGVNRAMEAYYGPVHGDAATSSLTMVAAVLQGMGSRGAPRYASAEKPLGLGFIVRSFESQTHKGIIVYRLYPAPPGLAAGSYIISLRIAAADRAKWASDGERIATAVVASINCTTMLTPRRGNDIELPRPGDPPGMRRRRGGGETNDLADYNAQLGTQWVHSPTTGQSFVVDAAAAWNENGPDGPGYYRKAGNSYEKLTTGFQH